MAQHIKLSVQQSPRNDQERAEMRDIPYSNIVGSIMYSMICTRPDLAHEISVTRRYMKKPCTDHWLTLKWMLRYLKGSKGTGISYKRKTGRNVDALMGFTESDYAVNIDSRRSQSGYIFKLYGGAVSWKSSLQPTVVLSTTGAEYVALTEAVKEGMWL